MKNVKSVVCMLLLSPLMMVYSQSYSFQAFWETKKGKSHEVVSLGVPESEFQKAFNMFEKEGLELTLVDGYDMDGKTYINFVYQTASGKKWFARHGMTAKSYQNAFNRYVTNGNYRLGWIDSYRRGNSIRYAAIFTQKGKGGQKAYHGISQKQHQSRFDQWTKNGWDPVNVSVVSINQKRYYTAFYEKKPGGFTLKSFLTRNAFETAHEAQKSKGLNLTYMNAYTYDQNMLPRFVAIWREGMGSGTYLPNVYGPTMMDKAEDLGPKGYFTRFVTGYGVGTGHRYDAYWFKPELSVVASPNLIIKN